MSSLLELREKLRVFYSKTEVYLTPFLKFVLAMFTLLCINANIGYMTKLTSSLPILLVVSLLCSFLPLSFTVVFAALFVCGHMYALSLECAVVAVGIFLIMMILYFRFSPKDSIVVILLPICFMLKIPYIIPIAVGLLCAPSSIVAVAFGTIVYYMILFVKENAQTISSTDIDNAVAKFRFVIDGVIGNKEVLLTVIAFAAVVVVVYVIRKLAIDHAWTIAMSAGAVVEVVILLVGELTYNTHISMLSLIFGTIVSLLLAKVLQFFVFNVDYSRTEYVQFEDDEYCYYVKAVPKNSVSKSEVRVQKITSVL